MFSLSFTCSWFWDFIKFVYPPARKRKKPELVCAIWFYCLLTFIVPFETECWFAYNLNSSDSFWSIVFCPFLSVCSLYFTNAVMCRSWSFFRWNSFYGECGPWREYGCHFGFALPCKWLAFCLAYFWNYLLTI